MDQQTAAWVQYVPIVVLSVALLALWMDLKRSRRDSKEEFAAAVRSIIREEIQTSYRSTMAPGGAMSEQYASTTEIKVLTERIEGMRTNADRVEQKLDNGISELRNLIQNGSR